MVIGLSGKYCSGKNSAAALLEDKGIPSIDVDRLGHAALEANAEKIIAEFGGSVAGPDGSVDRKALGNIVFSDPESLKRLEAVSHPWMAEETSRLVNRYLSSGSRHVVINAAVLYRMGLHSLCDCVIWIDAPLFLRILRGLNRDPLNLPSVLKRILAQRQLKPQPLAESVDIYRVGNRSGIEALRTELEKVLVQIEQKGRYGR